MNRQQFAKTPVDGRAQAIRDALNGDTIKKAYDKGMNLSRFLEHLDPTRDHKGQDAQLDAFNRVLRSCGIRTKSVPELGIPASTLEDVVNHPKARHLAVELIARAYRGTVTNKRAPMQSEMNIAGTWLSQFAYPAAPRANFIEPAIPLSEVVGQTTGITQKYYKPFYMQDIENVTARVSEAAEIPAVKISTTEKVINLQKYGRRLDITYEAIRSIPIDMLAFYVQRIAIKVEAEKVDKVIDIIVNGDGNAGTAATSYNLTTLDSGTTANNLTLKAWLAFKMKFKNPFQLTTIMSQDAGALALMLLNTGSANIPLVNAGGVFSQQAITPINNGLADGTRLGWLDTPPAGKLIGFDKRLSVERVFEIGANIQETDKDVKNQIDSLVLSEVEGYAIIEQTANKILNLTA